MSSETREYLDRLHRIETALTPEQTLALQRPLSQLDIDLDAWLEIPALHQAFVFFAALNLIERLEAEGQTRERASRDASAQLGVSMKTLETWRTRWKKYATGATAE